MKTKLVRGIKIFAVLYLAVLLTVFAVQRVFLYPGRVFPSRVPQIANGKLYAIPVPGNSKVFAFYLPSHGNGPTIVHFHGNGEQLADEIELAEDLHSQGFGVFAVEYPGFGMAKRFHTSEKAIYTDSEAALLFLIKKLGVPSASIVLQGQSLGSGVAAEMALRGYGKALILISPYTSIADMGSYEPPFSLVAGIMPVHSLALDKFETLNKAPAITEPVLIIHGGDDKNIPPVMGERLAAVFPHAKLKIITGGHHNDLLVLHNREFIKTISDFIKSIYKKNTHGINQKTG